MSSESAQTSDTARLQDRVSERLEATLAPSTYRQATVESVDPGNGTVVLSFGCGCSGGLSPPEQASLRTDLVEDLPEVQSVLFGSGCGCGGGSRGRGGGHSHGHTTRPDDDSDGPRAPF
jgi:hypothetical protein